MDLGERNDGAVMDLSIPEAANVVALTLGLIGIGIALVPIVRDWRASRHARLVVVLEKLFRQDIQTVNERIRIENLGPSAAQEVQLVRIGTTSPDSYRPALDWHLPVEVLQPFQDHVLLLAPSAADADPTSAVLTWRDGSGDKRAQFALSPKYL